MRRRKKTNNSAATAAESIRLVIFGNCPLEAWPEGDGPDQGDPWDAFVRARSSANGDDLQTAKSLWREIAARDDIESRHVLQAWHFLRQHGEAPSGPVSSQVLGGVVEVPVNATHDLLAAYADGSVRYLNHTGKVAIIESTAALPPLAQAAKGLLSTVDHVAQTAGTWDKPSLPALPAGHARVTALTPAGIRFGQGPEEQMRGQRLAADVLDAALPLLLEVVAVTT